MVARLLGLRFSLLIGSLREDRSLASRSLFAAIAVILGAAAVAWVFLFVIPVDQAPAVITVVGSCIVLLWFLVPFFSAAGDALDPRRFLVFGVDGERLFVPVLIASFVSIPMLATLMVAVSAVIAWTRAGVPVVVGVLAAVVALLSCVLVARLGFALASLILPERRSREVQRLLLLCFTLALLPFVVFGVSLLTGGRVEQQLQELAALLAFTPLGAAWSAQAIAGGGTGFVVAVLAVAYATLLLWTWRTMFLRSASRPDRVRESHSDAGLGWFAMFPANSFGAIAARSIIYWTQDRRYLVNILIVPVVGAVSIVPLLIAGVPTSLAVLLPAPIMALLLGWLPHNDAAYDSSALWMHVSAGVRGIADRVGRLLPVLFMGLLLLAIATPVSIAFHGEWSYLAPFTGVVLCLFLSALGLSSVSSALAPYPVSRPGDSPFVQPQRTGATSFWAQLLVILGTIVVSLPSLIAAWSVLFGGGAAASVAALLWGVGVGAGVFIVGIAIGSAVFERRRHALMDFATAQ